MLSSLRYQVLSDKKRRRDYDLHGKGGKGEGFIDAKAESWCVQRGGRGFAVLSSVVVIVFDPRVLPAVLPCLLCL